MKAILGTHAFIWLDSDPAMLSPRVMSYLHNPVCTVFLSLASVWEMVIKVGINKLQLTDSVEHVVTEHLKRTPLQLLPIEYDHILRIGSLPSLHRDPFDRMLVAQAMVENAVILTIDPKIQQYPIRTDW